MLRWYHVFCIAFAGTLLAQTWIWQTDTLTDERVWEERLAFFKQDLRAGNFNQQHYSAHPGFPPLWLAMITGLEPSIAIWVSLIVAGIAVVVHSMTPQSGWWLAAAGLSALHPMYVQSTPATAVAGPAACLGLLCLLAFQKNKQMWTAWVMGVAFGISLATHFSISLLLAGPALAFAGSSLALAAAFITFSALDPLFVLHPLAHLQFNTHYIALHTTSLGVARLTARDIVFFSPLATLGFLNRLTQIFQKRSAFFIGLTVAVIAALLYAQSQSVRYFFPLLLFWEIMSVEWLLKLAARASFPKVAQVVGVIMIIASQAFLLWHAL